MSYSRWTDDNVWYTWWNVPDGYVENRNNARLAVMAYGPAEPEAMLFTAARLRHQLEACIAECQTQAPDADTAPLRTVIPAFLADIDEHYPPPKKGDE